MNKLSTPTLDKIEKVHDESQNVGNFLEWLLENEIILGKYHNHSSDCFIPHEHNEECFSPCKRKKENVCGYNDGSMVPLNKTIVQLLHEYFEIDPNEAEKERRLILQNIKDFKK